MLMQILFILIFWIIGITNTAYYFYRRGYRAGFKKGRVEGGAYFEQIVLESNLKKPPEDGSQHFPLRRRG